MPQFQYTAIKKDGKKIQGKYNSDTKEEVILMLKENDYYPVNVVLSTGSKDIKISSFTKVKSKDIAIFSRQFYTMLNAGVNILYSLDILRYQTKNSKLKKAITEIYEDVQKGMIFSDALDKHGHIFPKLFLNMARAGESSGNLDVIMEKMAQHYEKENKINNKIRSAMIYPIILSLVAFLVVIFLITIVMPTFVSMFESSGVALPLPTKILLEISDFIKKYWYFLFFAIIVFIYIVRKYSRSNRGMYKIDKFKLKVPILKNTLKMIITSRFTRTLSLLQSSGISLIESLELTSKILGNKAASDFINYSKEEVKRGNSLGDTIDGTSLFPPMLSAMVKIGEESGSLDEILNKTADFYDDEVESSIEKFTTMLEPIMIIFMAIIIGSIVMAMVLPMFDMINTISF